TQLEKIRDDLKNNSHNAIKMVQENDCRIDSFSNEATTLVENMRVDVERLAELPKMLGFNNQECQLVCQKRNDKAFEELKAALPARKRRKLIMGKFNAKIKHTNIELD
ncbi:2463_t:CDS:2, partial [Paraglomus occultum]